MRPLVLPAARWSRTPDELREDPAAVSSRAPPPSYPDHVHSPSLPPSNAAGGWPTQPPPTPAPTVLPSTNGPLKPWLGLRARLFLSLLSPSLLALIFVGATILMGTDDVDDKVNAAKQRLTSACASAEGSASAAMSLPRYLADRANAQTAESIEATVRGVGRVLDLSLTAIERLLVFLVDSYRSLFLCFIELLVRGSLSLLIAAITALNEGVHAIAGGLKDALQSSVSGVNSFLSATLGGINDVIGVFGQHVNVPTIQPPDLAALDNVSLPTSFDEGLRRLNSSLPTLSELRAKVDGMISGPFEQLRAEVNTTVSAFQFDRSLMPLPEARIASFCADIDMQPLDDLAHDLRKLAYWATAIIAFIALAFALLTMAMEWWSWRSLRRHVENTRDAWIAADGFPSTMSGSTNRDSKTSTLTGSPEAAARYRGVLSTPSLFSLLQLSSHPLLSLLTFRLAKPLGIRSSEAKARLRWWLAWISHPIAVAALIIGTVGLASSQLQILALRGVQERYEGKIDGSFTTMGDKVLAQLNRGLTDASHDFANRSNEMIIGAQNGLNDNLFAWVNATTSTMNHTLNEMIEGIAGALNDSFASTPLYTPVQGFIDCALLSKLRSIEQALTWLQTNAHVEFERISPDILQLSHARSDELVAPIKQAALGSQQDHNDGVVGGIVSSYIKHLHHQQILYLVFVGLYCLAWIAGTCIVLAHSTKGVGRNHAYPKSGITPYPFTLHEPPSPAYEERADDRDGSVRGHHSITPPLHPDVVAQLQNSRSATCGPGELADAGGQYWRRDQSHQPSAAINQSWESILDARSATKAAEQPTPSSILYVPWFLQRSPSDAPRTTASKQSVNSILSYLRPEEEARVVCGARSPSNYSIESGPACSTRAHPERDPKGVTRRISDIFVKGLQWWFSAPEAKQENDEAARCVGARLVADQSSECSSLVACSRDAISVLPEAADFDRARSQQIYDSTHNLRFTATPMLEVEARRQQLAPQACATDPSDDDTDKQCALSSQSAPAHPVASQGTQDSAICARTGISPSSPLSTLPAPLVPTAQPPRKAVRPHSLRASTTPASFAQPSRLSLPSAPSKPQGPRQFRKPVPLRATRSGSIKDHLLYPSQRSPKTRLSTIQESAHSSSTSASYAGRIPFPAAGPAYF